MAEAPVGAVVPHGGWVYSGRIAFEGADPPPGSAYKVPLGQDVVTGALLKTLKKKADDEQSDGE